MQAPGYAVIEQAKSDGSWAALDAVESLAIPDDLQQALEKLPSALTNFDRFPRSAKRAILEWISNAKRIETRTARIAETAEMAARNLRANHPRQVKSARS